jgi:hypothetical protein
MKLLRCHNHDSEILFSIHFSARPEVIVSLMPSKMLPEHFIMDNIKIIYVDTEEINFDKISEPEIKLRTRRIFIKKLVE